MKYFVHFKNICFNKTSATDQFKTKIGNYNTSFLSSFSLLKYLFVLPLNFIARKEFMSYITEGVSLTRPLVFVNKA